MLAAGEGDRERDSAVVVKEEPKEAGVAPVSDAASQLLLQQQQLLEQQQQQLQALVQAGGIPAAELALLVQKAEQLQQLQSLQQHLVKSSFLPAPPSPGDNGPVMMPPMHQRMGAEFNEVSVCVVLCQMFSNRCHPRRHYWTMTLTIAVRKKQSLKTSHT